MKTLDEILKQRPVYLNDWAEGKKIQLVSDFEDIFMSKSEYEAKEAPYPNIDSWKRKKIEMKEALKKYSDKKILFASYGYANYSGDAWVLFEKEGKLFEVNGSHCSCYGLEGQFEPEETDLKALEFRLQKGTWGLDGWSDNNFREELIKFLGVKLPS